MKTIYKYPLDVTDMQTIVMPAFSKIISVQTQNNQLVLWAIVDTNEGTEHRHIAIIGTGNPFDLEGYYHLGTVQLDGLVWHVFEIFKP